MRFALAFCVAFFMVQAPALADYFVWKDPKSGISLSYPDTWKMASQRQPEEVLTLLAPSTSGEDALCRVRVREDRRYLIYPPHLGREVQTVSYNRDFWDEYLNEYDNVAVYGTVDEAALGRGFGSFVVAGYDAAMFSPDRRRRGIAASSLYFDKAYIVDCSASIESFERWQPLFLSVIGSVDFTKTHDELWSGNYRNFFADPRLEFKWPGTQAVNRY